MQNDIKESLTTDFHQELTEDILLKLRCPCCGSRLKDGCGRLFCRSDECSVIFPVVDGIPILINDSNSLFSVSDFEDSSYTYAPPLSKFAQFAKSISPTIVRNMNIKEKFSRLVEILLADSANPKVMIIGGSVIGKGLKDLLEHPAIHFVESDVSFGPRTAVICDAHDIPFENETFDAVIVQVTLEHVLDPYRCVEEIHRVLKKTGVVYAETPFMEAVHNGKYDFTRFSHVGHRRLFRKFTELSSGIQGGPGMALACSYMNFLLSFFKSKYLRSAVKVFVRLTVWWLKYIDYYLAKKPGAYDAALEYYFMGRKNDKTLSDKEILEAYKGAQTDF